ANLYLFNPFSYIIFSSKTRFSYNFSSTKHPRKNYLLPCTKLLPFYHFQASNCFYHLKAFNLLFFFIQFFPYTMIRKTHKF
ncbi:hypothetical protein ES319_D01G172200v1, partial [Gossypium barbadense]